MASWRQKVELCPDSHNYQDKFDKPKIIGYYSSGKNSEPIEDLSGLKYLSYKPTPINLDISRKEYKNDNYDKPDTFFQFISSHKEVIQRCTGTGIKDVGFVTYRNTLSEIGSTLYNKWNDLVLCAHLFKGVIYLYRDVKTQRNTITPNSFNQYCFQQSDDSDFDKKFMIILEAKLKKHNIIYESELVGIESNDDRIPQNLGKDLAIDEINKRKNIELFISTNPIITKSKSMRMWSKCYWGNVDKTILGFTNENGIVTKVMPYHISDLENIGKGLWKGHDLLNFIDETLTFIKGCFEKKIENVDVNSANKRLYFIKKERHYIELLDDLKFIGPHWVPDWFINN